jgi:hypothetical protein
MTEDEMDGHVACMEEMRNAYRIFVGKQEGRYGRILEFILKKYSRNMNWIHLTQDRIKLWAPVKR